jgi:transcriptional regulator with XRE-family HTH domain
MNFSQNKVYLDSETIAEQLRLARQDKGVKLERAARELKINIKYLDALERGRFELLPKGLYGKNFLKEYAMYLQLDYRDLLELFDGEVAAGQKVKERDLFNKQKIKAHDLLSYPRMLRGLLISVMIVMVAAYLIVRLQRIVAPPVLTISYPPENFVTTEAALELRGGVESESQLIINGEPVVSSGTGEFAKSIGLKPGMNIITLVAQKKYGRSRVETRRVLRQ